MKAEFNPKYVETIKYRRALPLTTQCKFSAYVKNPFSCKFSVFGHFMGLALKRLKE